MKTKQKKESEKVICIKCNEEIDTTKEFCQLIQYRKKGDIFKEGFYHINCYIEGKENAELRGKANKLIEKTNKLLERFT